MARLYLDSDGSHGPAFRLRSSGHDVVTAHTSGRRAAGDEQELLFAAQDQRLLLTHDRDDFATLHRAWIHWPTTWGFSAPAHAGILVLDHAPERDLAAAVDSFLRETPPLTNALYRWRANRDWYRPAADRRWAPYP